jgi:endonuclease YncB( thermonuclease family)
MSMNGLTLSSFPRKRASLTAGALFLSVSLSLSAFAAPLPEASHLSSFGGIAKVVDGDTLDISGERIRLEGIDAPERDQVCKMADGRPWSCGEAATRMLRTLVGNRELVCERRGMDKYRRALAVCFVGGENINEAMVRAGYAWAFVRYSSEFVDAEAEARAAKSGVWQGAAQAPWEFRHNEWQVAETAAPSGCAIKGNITSNGHIYHMPWSAWYDRVKIDEKRGERWFCSEAEATAAGWRPAAAH